MIFLKQSNTWQAAIVCGKIIVGQKFNKIFYLTFGLNYAHTPLHRSSQAENPDEWYQISRLTLQSQPHPFILLFFTFFITVLYVHGLEFEIYQLFYGDEICMAFIIDSYNKYDIWDR